MLVVDASAFVELLIGASGAAALRGYAAQDSHWVVPEHFTIEVVNALRGLWLRKEITVAAFEGGVNRLATAQLQTWPVRLLLPRIVELAPNASAYDAAYIALAEALGVPLLTGDARLTRVPQTCCSFLPRR